MCIGHTAKWVNRTNSSLWLYICCWLFKKKSNEMIYFFAKRKQKPTTSWSFELFETATERTITCFVTITIRKTKTYKNIKQRNKNRFSIWFWFKSITYMHSISILTVLLFYQHQTPPLNRKNKSSSSFYSLFNSQSRILLNLFEEKK